MRVNAVFEGGGVKGIALVGAIQAAEAHDVTFHRLAGTSAGAIVAACLAAGYSAEELKRVILATPFSSFLRNGPAFQWLGPFTRMMFKKGLYSGGVLEQWIRDLLRAKGVRTFGDLPEGKLRIIASDITNGKLLVLPQDLSDYGMKPSSFDVARAVRMSASIPYFFDPVIIRYATADTAKVSRKKMNAYIVDGGLLSNFPLWLFEQDRDPGTRQMVPVVGFNLVGKNEQRPHHIRGIFSMLEAIFETMLSARDERYIEQINRYRTIKIPTLGVRNTQFHLTNEESMRLYDAGYEAGMKFFEQWTYEDYVTNFKQHIHIGTKKK